MNFFAHIFIGVCWIVFVLLAAHIVWEMTHKDFYPQMIVMGGFIFTTEITNLIGKWMGLRK